MTSKTKRLARYRNNPKNVSFEELKSLLESYGFEVQNHSGGSHYSVSHKKYNVIGMLEPNTIPSKKQHILRIYVTRAIGWIEKVVEIQEAEEEAKNEEK